MGAVALRDLNVTNLTGKAEAGRLLLACRGRDGRVGMAQLGAARPQAGKEDGK